MVKLLDGVEASKSLRAQVAEGVLEMQQKHRVTPGLAAVLVGYDPASAVYVRNKERACAEVGILSEVFRLEQDASEEELLETVARLNADSRYHGILVQLPLPDAIDPLRVAESLDPMKDVDGIHPANLGRLVGGTPRFVPCTPAGVQQLLMHNGYDPDGKHVVICGRSQIVGLPLGPTADAKDVKAPTPPSLYATPAPKTSRASPAKPTFWWPLWGRRGPLPPTW